MGPILYRRVKEMLGSRKTEDSPKASNAPIVSPTAQASNTSLDQLTHIASSSSKARLSTPTWGSRLATSDRWLFDLLARDTWPQGATCEACANLSLLFTTGSRRPKRPPLTDSKNAVQHHKFFATLASVSRECELCALLLACFKQARRDGLLGMVLKQERESYFDGIRRPNADIARQSVRVMVEECYGSGKLVSELRVTIQLVTSSGRHAISGSRRNAERVADDIVRVYTEADDVTASKIQGRVVSKTGGDPRTLQLAQVWIEDCYNNHPECRWSEDDSQLIESDPLLPTRVIDIGISDQEVPRLILSNGRRGKWAALSHRWPRDENSILRLVAKNIEDMQRAIPRESLAPTFRDALRITRVLGLRYLWVDSLCILQDSPEDWKEQSSRMPDIYKNSFVTIAAAATKDCLGGILGQRDWVPASRPCSLWVDNDDRNAPGQVFVDFCIDRHHKKDAKTKTNDVNYLAYRAWCFQESLLSHRLLTFDRLQMSFACLRHGQFEDREIMPAVAREYRNDFLPSFRGPLLDDANTLQSALQSWYNVLADYTNRNLTFPSDKLVAISGIANVVGSFLRDEYYAGLWRKSLP